MDLLDRILLLSLGGCIGFVLGYIVRALQEIKERVDHVDEAVSDVTHQKHNERGSTSLLQSWPVLIAVLITALAAILSGKANHESRETQHQLAETQTHLAEVTRCNQIYLSTLLKAVDERTTAGQIQTNANADLQQAWYTFVRFQLHVPPYPEVEQRVKATEYAKALKSFLDASSKQQKKVMQYPYPTDDGLSKCIQKAEANNG